MRLGSSKALSQFESSANVLASELVVDGQDSIFALFGSNECVVYSYVYTLDLRTNQARAVELAALPSSAFKPAWNT